MSEQKWTKGEWHHAGSVVRDEHDHDIAQMVAERRWEPGYGVPRDRSEIQANAALMAASPCMFKELDAVCEFDEHIGWCPHCDAEARQFCPGAVELLLAGYERRKAAIKKAVGQ